MKEKIIIVLALVISFGSCILAESEEDCTVKDHLPCKLYRSIQDCSPLSLRERFPFFYANDSWPGEVSSFDARMTEEVYPGNNKPYPKGIFTFTPPQDVGIGYVKGFAVTRYRSDSTFPTCYVFDLSNATWKGGSEDFKTVFTLTLFPMAQNKLYVMDVYTLPKLPGEFEKGKSLELNIKTSDENTDDNPQTWKASIVYQLDKQNKEVSLSFSQPPRNYNFTLFEVTLKNLTDGVRQVVYIHTTEYVFRDIFNGVYEIWVMPMQTPQCGCRASEFVCDHCLTTKTRNFTVDFGLLPVPKTDSPTSSKHSSPVSGTYSTKVQSSDSTQVSSIDTSQAPLREEDDTTKVVLAVVGSFLGVGLVTCMLVLYWFCRRKTRGDENDNYKPPVIDDDNSSMVTVAQLKSGAAMNNSNDKKVKLERRPKLFILYEEDHPFHRKVIDSFAGYLQSHCQCDVMPAQLRLETTWVHQEIQNADYVIIVNSKLAFALYESLLFKSRGDAQHTSSGNIKTPGINCILQRFLQEPHYDKTVMVFFDYTGEELIIPDICPGYNYKLMKHFTDFLLHIHKLKRTDNLAQYDLPLDGKYDLKPVGKELQTAITQAAAYEREHPEWFHQRYGYLRSFSNASDESGFDSGPPQEPVFLGDPISKQLHVYMDATSQDVITVTPPVVTPYGHTYLSQSPHSFQQQVYSGMDGRQPHHETPTTADSGGQFDFISPDDISEFETASKTQSEQMMSINARNIGHQYDNKGYNWQQDLTLLRVQSGEITFEDSHSLGGESV